jgi:hypothetical protein
MRIIWIIILAFIINLSGEAIGQSNYNLSDYKLPRLKRQLLEVEFDLNGSNNSLQRSDDRDFDMGAFRGGLKLNYQYYLNTDRVQRSLFSNASIATANESYSHHQFYQSSNLHRNFNVDAVNRYYFHNRYFVETNFRGDINKAFRQWQNDWEDRNNPSFEYRLEVPLKIGWGRIEQVQDARQAIYIVDELTGIGRMQQDLSRDEMYEFANLISELHNRRFFDSRLKTIDNLEKLDQFLTSRNYITASDVRYFSTLADMWAYGSHTIRRSGNRLSLEIIPAYFFSHQENSTTHVNYGDSEESRTNKDYSLKTGIQFEHEKPLNLTWQNALQLKAYIGKDISVVENSTGDDPISFEQSYLETGIRHMMGYFPNTRTDATFSTRLDYKKYAGSYDDDWGVNGFEIQTAVQIQLNYYISPRFRLSASAYMGYSWNDKEDNNFMYQQFNQLQSKGITIRYHSGLIYKFM